MRKFKSVSLLALCLAATMATPINENERALQEVSQGAGHFSSAFFKTVSEAQPGNLITSPLSCDIVLSMIAYGAGGNTQKQFKDVLHLPSQDSVARTGFQSLIDGLNSVKDVTLKVANKVFLAENFNVKPEFQQLTESSFRSASQKVNFVNSEAATGTINNWCEENTNHRIKDLLQSGDVDGSTAMVLVNAVYFKGSWKEKFDPELTSDRPFHVDANTVKNVPTMMKNGKFRYGDLPDLKASFVELPYKGDELSMIIILPNEINGLAELERNLQNTELSTILDKGFKRDVDLYLPKFKIESTLQLNPILAKMGLTDMFTDQADFSGIANEPLKVSKVVQKAFIEVNEEGSEAAAATAVEIMLYCGPMVTEMRVDRPFVYNIVKTARNKDGKISETTTLFGGRVVHPTM